MYKCNNRVEASKEVFKLDKIYQAHLDEVTEVKILEIKYMKQYKV